LSVDEFAGPLAGLIMAEAEFDDMVSVSGYAIPDFAFHEVTEDIRYTGGELVLNVRPEGVEGGRG
jgi:CYTH domain-containing protein